MSLRKLRTSALLTLEELSVRSGVSMQTISSYENEKRPGRRPRFSTVKRLARALGMGAKELWRVMAERRRRT